MINLYRDYAGLYDIAFDWDDSGQVVSICELTGLSHGRVLEPMCGTGRLLNTFCQMAVDESLEHKRLYWQQLTLG